MNYASYGKPVPIFLLLSLIVSNVSLRTIENIILGLAIIKKIILGLAIIHEISVDAQKQLPNFEMIMIEGGIALLQLKSYGDRWTKTGQ